MQWDTLQTFMRDHRIDGWLVYDFRTSNQVFTRLLPAPAGVKRWTTRRAALFIPGSGKPILLCHGIDNNAFLSFEQWGVSRELYLSWPDFHAWLSRHVSGKRIAMEYSPGAALPIVSIVDAGTIDLVRALGAEVVSSADLMQVAIAKWPADSVALHSVASCDAAGIKDAAFAFIRERLASGKPVHEHEVAQHIRDGFAAKGLQYPDGPIVAVNEHAADPHYEPSEAKPTPIRKGDWILIDMWARKPGDENIHSDITWTGYAGTTVPPRHRLVFETVKAARDAALALAVDSFKAGRAVQGWQLDDAARNVIIAAGFEKGIRHRTGHSLSPGSLVHGTGMNLDNLETHDTRQMLPGTGFTIEPGIYLPDERLGVRNEINVYVDPVKGPVVTSCKQDDVVLVA